MDILMSETCWAHNKWNKIASDIKLVFRSSTIAMMHGPINIRFLNLYFKIRTSDKYDGNYIWLYSWLRYSKFSARSTGWLAWATLKTLLNSSHVLLWCTWWAGAPAFTQTAYLLKLVIPTTNALPPWRLNVETKTKRTLHSSRRLSFNELTNAKNLVLHSSNFASGDRGSAVVKVLCYKSEGHWFDPSWCHWNFSLT